MCTTFHAPCLQKCLCDMLELCLYTIQCVKNLSDNAPTEVDTTLTPLPFSYLCVNTHFRVQLLVQLKVSKVVVSRHKVNCHSLNLKSLENDVQKMYAKAIEQERNLWVCHMKVVSR